MTTVRDEHHQQQILTVNGGSSSIKFALYNIGNQTVQTMHGSIVRIGLTGSTFSVVDSNPEMSFLRSIDVADHTQAVEILMDWLSGRFGAEGLSGVGHRIVHGGPKYTVPIKITPDVVAELKRISPFDPEHLPEEILLTEAFHRKFPHVPQVACFDTSFHKDMPQVARLLPIPRRYEAQGVRKYGFHGLSYQFMMERIAQLDGADAAKGRLILAHLGNGASLAAVRNGASIDTSMSFTPTSGVPMSTRSGDLDPGLIWYLARTDGLDVNRLNQMINFQSGLLGMSETSSDMRDLLSSEAHDVRAADAIAVFCYQVKKWIGGFTAALGGLDTLVFAGGIGENAPEVRSRICSNMDFIGMLIDPKLNESNAPVISAEGSRVRVRVIKTDEEQIIARSTREVLRLTDTA